MKRDSRKLYYHPKRKYFITLTPIGDSVVIEESENWCTRFLKKNYVMPSKRGFKLVGEIK